MEQSKYRETGNLKISEDVISTIAGLTTSEIKGVAGLSLRPNITDSRIKGIFSKNTVGRAIRLEMREGEAVVDVYVNLYLGAKIPEVAGEVQAKVKEAIQNMTGITVSKVNVHISGVIISQQDDERIG